MMGLPGSGKTTYANKLKTYMNNCLLISSDDLREELFGFRDQTRNKELFEELNRRVLEHSDKGDCIYDATSLNKEDRRNIVNTFKNKYNLKIIFLVSPVLHILQVNFDRHGTEQYVPKEALRNMFGKIEMPTYDEGWSEITFIKNNESISSADFININTIMEWLPSLPHDNPHHKETIKEHIYRTMQLAQHYFIDIPDLYTIAKYHDLGKFFVRAYNEDKGYFQYIGHSNLSAYIYLTNYLNKVNITSVVEKILVPNNINVTPITEKILIPRFFFMYYAILYHDRFYTFASKEEVIKNLSQPKKSLIKVFESFEEDPEYNFNQLILTLQRFNKIDREASQTELIDYHYQASIYL